MLEPEAVIVSLNTDIYNMKCKLLLLQIENAALRARLLEIENVVLKPLEKAVGA